MLASPGLLKTTRVAFATIDVVLSSEFLDNLPAMLVRLGASAVMMQLNAIYLYQDYYPFSIDNRISD